MLLAGLRQHHAFDALPVTIPPQWQRFRALGALPGRVGLAHYGAMCGTDHDKRVLEYMCAVEVETFDDLPREISGETIGRMRVPEARYAVFRHEGGVDTLNVLWAAIWQDWVPRTGVKPAATPDFERYGERFDIATGRGDIEVWFPIG